MWEPQACLRRYFNDRVPHVKHAQALETLLLVTKHRDGERRGLVVDIDALNRGDRHADGVVARAELHSHAGLDEAVDDAALQHDGKAAFVDVDLVDLELGSHGREYTRPL